mmetsp:Transcript_83751/g.135794  ORF Transcript_83751/g.135794 Transcript_83751/m.135794 type:complete len:181 (-) Transcript_83751:407-949(-)
MNEALVQLFDFGMCAQFCLPTAWGMPVQLTDGASTFSIVVPQANGSKAEFIQNKKTSGAGADISTQVKTQNDNAYGRWLVVCNELMAFYNSEKCRDKTAKWVSPMAMATYNGSGPSRPSSGAPCRTRATTTLTAWRSRSTSTFCGSSSRRGSLLTNGRGRGATAARAWRWCICTICRAAA